MIYTHVVAHPQCTGLYIRFTVTSLFLNNATCACKNHNKIKHRATTPSTFQEMKHPSKNQTWAQNSYLQGLCIRVQMIELICRSHHFKQTKICFLSTPDCEALGRFFITVVAQTSAADSSGTRKSSTPEKTDKETF